MNNNQLIDVCTVYKYKVHTDWSGVCVNLPEAMAEPRRVEVDNMNELYCDVKWYVFDHVLVVMASSQCDLTLVVEF